MKSYLYRFKYEYFGGRPFTFVDSSGDTGEVKSLNAVICGKNNAKGIAKVAISGATTVSNLLQDIRQKVT